LANIELTLMMDELNWKGESENADADDATAEVADTVARLEGLSLASDTAETVEIAQDALLTSDVVFESACGFPTYTNYVVGGICVVTCKSYS
jgi:hypothetical protein